MQKIRGERAISACQPGIVAGYQGTVPAIAITGKNALV